MRKALVYFILLIVVLSCRDKVKQYYWVEPTLNGTIDSIVLIRKDVLVDSSKYIFIGKDLERIVHYKDREIYSIDSQYIINNNRNVIYFGNFDLGDTLFNGYSNVKLNKNNILLEKNIFFMGKKTDNIKYFYDNQFLKSCIDNYNSNSDTLYFEYDNRGQLIEKYFRNGSSTIYQNYILDDSSNWIYRKVINVDKNNKEYSSYVEERIYYYN
ncbi:hypothetical protein [Flammeovirga aprica]|uniref:Uncharacterized protein n=1 Tax=Flammeovirga aprica JL-4 TaxID=694437 RepID=A0A7X9XD73_9BACT|nr:hypothetical protein [Flammeovirga aprica]NME72567.1 hypothetical protein [Flammeovirga aprica JL-4]